MAIFEDCTKRRITLDDTEEICCVIETAQEVNGHTEYVLKLQRGPNKQNIWKILRRYNDFVELDKHLKPSGIKLPLPEKRFFGNMRPDFIAERRKALQIYINSVLMNPILASSLPAKRFVDPDSYSQSFHDQAVQNALLCLRNENNWTLGTTFGPIGWRLRKHYFKVLTKPPEKVKLVKSGSQSHQSKSFTPSSSGGSLDGSSIDSSELALEWVEYGPDKYIEDKDLGIILKSLMGLQHAHIEPIVYATHNENGCLVIRKFHRHGTLKDMLCISTPKNPFQSKYGNPRGRTKLNVRQLANYGRQILETLIFLHSKGYPYGHLHSGNVVIVDDCVKLLDIENYVLGVPAFYRPFFVQHSKIHSTETVDVYCFGHVLFEMSMGYPLQESVVRQIPDCPEMLKDVLERILSKEACRAGLPTLEQLVNHQFFKQVPNSNGRVESVGDPSSSYFKLPTSAKEALMKSCQRSENRLRDEQKSVKNQKRIVRVQEMMSSEEEKRKTKQKTKTENKQLKLKQQNSLQNNSGRQTLLGNASTPTSTTPTTTTATTSEAGSFNRSESIAAVNYCQEAKREQERREELMQTISVEKQSSSPNISSDDTNEPTRSALLESICKFNRGSLRKVRSND